MIRKPRTQMNFHFFPMKGDIAKRTDVAARSIAPKFVAGEILGFTRPRVGPGA